MKIDQEQNIGQCRPQQTEKLMVKVVANIGKKLSSRNEKKEMKEHNIDERVGQEGDEDVIVVEYNIDLIEFDGSKSNFVELVVTDVMIVVKDGQDFFNC